MIRVRPDRIRKEENNMYKLFVVPNPIAIEKDAVYDKDMLLDELAIILDECHIMPDINIPQAFCSNRGNDEDVLMACSLIQFDYPEIYALLSTLAYMDNDEQLHVLNN